VGRHTDPTSDTMYCYGANSQSQNQSTLKTRNTFNATATAPTNSANMMRATKVDCEPPQARNAALIAKRVQCIPLQAHPQNFDLLKIGIESQNIMRRKFQQFLEIFIKLHVFVIESLSV